MAALNNTISPFFSLPAEVRNIIYRHLLIGGRAATAAPYAQILRTCKRINHEATGILYAENVFRLFIDWRNVLVYKFPLFSFDKSFISPDVPDLSYVPPPFSTDIPLHRVEKLAVYIRGLFKTHQYEYLVVEKLIRNVLRLCRHWPKHHALKKLFTSIFWLAPANFDRNAYLTDPLEEEMILEPFFELQNIESVTIRGAMRARDAMHGEHEWEDVF
ncbi:MAG: hypothetical protein FRX48_02012 [Lasallia pustulata]|uniref:F-box domain-containing protein n=1 Tax=Lasallia pustulata TaxID=136370 RepID=A0A5M8PW52_9LECA|nr:MAG: hypothetical protein FRX48_02012 [Lasallia pustulata]